MGDAAEASDRDKTSVVDNLYSRIAEDNQALIEMIPSGRYKASAGVS